MDWQLLGFHLELTKADIAEVDQDCQTVDERRVGMLWRWKDRFAFKATYRVFIEALLACGKAGDAIEACKIIAHVCVPSKWNTCYDRKLDPVLHICNNCRITS